MRTSLWFVPAVMVLVAFGLVLAGYAADAWLSRRSPGSSPLFVYVSMPGTARDMLSTLLASMITMTSLVFSITMVVLTLAANQFGPRLIRNFMALPHTQLALGTFVMTTVYCLLTLGLIGSRSSQEVQAFASVSLAIVLALLSIGVLVMFLHSLARSIVSETVITRVGLEVDEILCQFDKAGPDEDGAEAELPGDFDQKAHFFGPLGAGYVQALEMDALVREARRADVIIGISFRPGDYVAVDGGGIGVYPASRCTDELQAAIQEAVLIGPNRTPNQDPEFAIRHLVEIAVRALSPGINDPYTATAAVDQLSASLCELMTRALPRSDIRDDSGIVRLVSPTPTYASLIGAAFNQIRQNGSGKPMVVIHLIEAIIRTADHARREVQRQALKQHLEAILEAAHREISDAFDKAAVDERAEAARKALARSGRRIRKATG